MTATHSPAAETSAAVPNLEWREGEGLPDPSGRKGMYGGVSAGHVLLAGGSNFPVPLRAGGKKTFHRDVFVRPLPYARAEPWRVASFQLAIAIGEGAAVTTELGIACIGGHDGSGPVADVFLLRWNRATNAVERHALPELPDPAANVAAVLMDGWLYVAGGEGAKGVLGTFRRLNLVKAAADPRSSAWEALPGWPGVKRFGSVANVVTTASGKRVLLAGGLPGPAKVAGDYLRDVMLFDAGSRQWTNAAPMPRGAVLGAAIAINSSRVLVLGGSDGHDFERMKELGEQYRIPSDVLVYEADLNRWKAGGTMPMGVVGASVIDLGDGWLVAGGEYSPGLRTPKVYQLRLGVR